MIKKNQTHINRLNALTDGILLFTTYPLASWLWLDVISNSQGNMASISNFDGFLLVWALIYSAWTVGILTMLSVYHTNRIQNRKRRYQTIFVGNLLGMATVTTALYLFRLQEFSRGVLGVYFMLSNAALIGKRYCMFTIMRTVRAKGYNLKHILVVGSGALAMEFAENISQNPDLGLRIDETLRPGDNLMGELESWVHNAGIDEVVLAMEIEDLHYTEKVLQVCVQNGVKASVIPFYNSFIPTKPTVENLGSTKLIRLQTIPLDDPANAFFKRTFDIVFSAAGLALLSPLLLLIGILVRLSGPGPVIFRQERVGLNRQPFTMLKFRSMRPNNAENRAWSTERDNRRTRIGSLLRKTSLDELPQLWNVLKGDMSLVGPRPEIPCFVDQFRDNVPNYMMKHQVRPGITGWAQVNGYRGDTSIPGRIQCDLWYIDNWSMELDFKIILMTVFGGMINREKVGAGK